MSDPTSEHFGRGLDHAWSWFTVHASQRMQLVNFWIVAVAFLTTALVTALTNERFDVATVVSLAGAVGTFAFNRLERRTRSLVRAGEEALEKFQAELAAGSTVNELEILKRVDLHKPFWTYGTVIMVLHLVTLTTFLVVAGYSSSRWIDEPSRDDWILRVPVDTGQPSLHPCDIAFAVTSVVRDAGQVRLQVRDQHAARRAAACLERQGLPVDGPRRGRLN